jgi:hypothetical protein
MNQENFEYLSNNLKFMGFGEKLQGALREAMEEQKPEFQLSHRLNIGKDEAEVILFFRKSDNNNFYFFIKYWLSLQTEQHAEGLIQPFYIYKGRGITLKEGYNLLCGRAVNKDLENKEGQYYNAWLQLDLSSKEKEGYKIKQYHENYGFDLRREINKLPIKELQQNWEKEMLIKSLEKGNLQAVNFEEEGLERKMFIEANPQFRTINVYNSNMEEAKEKDPALVKYNDSVQLQTNEVNENETDKKITKKWPKGSKIN